MTRSPSFAGLILAAGASSRMGRDKALLPWRGETFLSLAIRSLMPLCDFVLVVGGENHDSISPVVYAQGAFLVRNPDPTRGQFSSLQVGLTEILNRGRDTAIITLVDRPAADPTTVSGLRTAYLEAIATDPAVWAAIPEYRGQHGHPYIAGRDLIEAFLRTPVTATARDVEHAYQKHLRYIPVEDANVIANVDTPEQYAEALHPQD